MKYFLSLILTSWICIISSAQVLPFNKKTNLISVQDSITFDPSINQKDIEPIIYQWQNFISTKGEANNVFNYDGIRDYIELSFSSKFKPSLDVFAIEGKMRNYYFRKILGQLLSLRWSHNSNYKTPTSADILRLRWCPHFKLLYAEA
jgi:hypothetical protein